MINLVFLCGKKIVGKVFELNQLQLSKRGMLENSHHIKAEMNVEELYLGIFSEKSDMVNVEIATWKISKVDDISFIYSDHFILMKKNVWFSIKGCMDLYELEATLSILNRLGQRGQKLMQAVGIDSIKKSVAIRTKLKTKLSRMFMKSVPSLLQPQILSETEIDRFIQSKFHYQRNQKYLDRKGISTRNHSEAILFIVPWLHVGGADKVNYDLIQQFINSGREVHVFTTLKSEHQWHQKFTKLTSRIIHIGNVFENINDALSFMLDYIIHHNISIIQISNSQLGYQVVNAIKEFVPSVKIVDLLHMEEPYYPFDYFRYSLLFKDQIDARVVITNSLKRSLVENYGESEERIKVIPNGIDIVPSYQSTNYDTKNEMGNIVIGFVGRMEEQKQPMIFLEIADKLSKRLEKVKYVMIGEGTLLEQVKCRTETYNICGRVTFLDSTVNAKFKMKEVMHILVAPSLREGLPIVGLEAMSLGIPIVATNVSGWNDLVIHGTTGFLGDINDVNSLVNYCERLILDKDMRKEMSLNCFEHIEQNYDIKHTAQKYLDVYNALK